MPTSKIAATVKVLTRGTVPKAVAAPLGEIRVMLAPIPSPMRAAMRLPIIALPDCASALMLPATT